MELREGKVFDWYLLQTWNEHFVLPAPNNFQQHWKVWESQSNVPFQLGSGMFTTATVNNIGPNTSSTSSQDSFHSTAISLVQHPKPGTERCTDVFNPVRSLVSRKTAAHPSYYTDVPPLTLPSTNIVVPNTSAQLVSVACEQALWGTLAVRAGKRRRACNYISGIWISALKKLMRNAD